MELAAGSLSPLESARSVPQSDGSLEGNYAAGQRMPDLAGGTHAHAHTVHSSLACLAALGVAAHRIVLRRMGREAAREGTIVRQSPSAGEPLLPHTLVELGIAGLGFSHALPVGLWDSGGEEAAGTREILEPVDDPLEKLKHWFHEGAPLFRIAPDAPDACSRWLALFGVAAADWPPALWYRLASLISSVPQLSCSERGCAFVLSTLLGLRVNAFRYRAALTLLPLESVSKLGARASRLGIDLLMGDAVEDLAVLELELGPVTLDTFERFTTPGGEGGALLRRTLEMILPVSVTYEVHWTVLDASRAPRLGLADHNARLGINTHMGSEMPPAQA